MKRGNGSSQNISAYHFICQDSIKIFVIQTKKPAQALHVNYGIQKFSSAVLAVMSTICAESAWQTQHRLSLPALYHLQGIKECHLISYPACIWYEFGCLT